MSKEIATTQPAQSSIDGLPIAEAYRILWSTLRNRPKSLIDEVRVYRKYLPLLLRYVKDANDQVKALQIKNHRLVDIDYDRAGMHWTQKEDELLINLVCDEDKNIHQISALLGRSPTAIKSRVTELVGVKKLSQTLAGRFIGSLNGKDVSGEIKGMLYKE